VRDFSSTIQETADFILSLWERPQNPLEHPRAHTIALAGGNTPLGLYLHLGNTHPELQAARRSDRDAENVQAFGPAVLYSHVFWGDERAVVIDSPRSNYAAAFHAMLKPLDFPSDQIHRIRAEERDLEAVAAGYEAEIHHVFARIWETQSRMANLLNPGEPLLPDPDRWERLDLVLLGLGEDGHIASLFPHAPALDEKQRWVVPAVQPGSGEKRVTLTLPFINRARNVVFLVSGKGKAGIVSKVFAAREPDKALPATLIRPDKGRVVWILDKAAAAGIPTSA
jgi:6-phosphogluconolactonase